MITMVYSAIKEHWKREFQKVLNDGKKFSINELAKKVSSSKSNEKGVRPETISRWVNYLEIEGFIKTEFAGIRRVVSLNEK